MSYFAQHKKRILVGAFFVLVFALTVWSVLRGQDPQLMMACLKGFRGVYLIPAVACMLVFVLGESVIICYLFRVLGYRVPFSHCAFYSFIGFFYSAITPSASGGQPMQVWAMCKDRIPAAVSTIVLAIVTITYKFVLVVLGVVVLAVRPAAVMVFLEPVMFWVWLGIVLNVVFIVALFLAVFSPRFIRRLVGGCLRFLHKVRILKNPEKWDQWLDDFVGQYTGTADFFRTHKRTVAKVFLLTVVQRWALFAITWLTYVGLGLGTGNFGLITTLQGMVSVAVDMLPLPGGMGASENLFLPIFAGIFGSTHVFAGLVVSRGISYYVQVILCGGMTAVATVMLKRHPLDLHQAGKH